MKYLNHSFICIFVLLLFVAPGHSLAAERQYTCPMHPHYIADRPGTCPICGMDLVPFDADGDGEADHSAMKHDKIERAEVTIAPETVQKMGVRKEKAQMAAFGTLVRSYGDVTENIRLQFDVSSRVEGWVERLETKAAGDEVNKGSLLFTLYSPALVAAQQDYLSALATGNSNRISSVEKRLTALGMQEAAIAEVRKSRKALQEVPFYAETDGLISAINIREGAYVKPGMSLMTLQNYDSIWIDVSIAEQDIVYISPDTKALVSMPARGIKDQKAEIDYIYPTIDKATRTGRVRLVLDNKDGRFKPGAYVDVEFETDVAMRLSVPGDAILKSKDGDFAVVALGDGRFEPRPVLTGLRYKNRTEILEGLSVNDEVVVSGQFLIDSESALRESFRKMRRMQKPLSLLEVGDDQMAMIDHLVDAALYIHKELTAGRIPSAKPLDPALTLGDHLLPVFAGTKLEFVLDDAEKALTQAQGSLTEKEWQDSLDALVTALKPWLLEGLPQHYKAKGLRMFHAHGLDKYWLQYGKGEGVNPYDGGHVMEMDWPEKVEADEGTGMPEMNEEDMPVGAGGAHGNH